MARLARRPGVRYPVLVPNVRGLARAEAAGVDAIAVFTAASDAFTTRNIRMTVDESIEAFGPSSPGPRELGWWRRAYVSTAFGCPYTGAVDPARVVEVAVRLLELGADEICFGDTIGVGVPPQVRDLTARAVDAGIPLDRIAYHFHDTRGTALANVAAAMSVGIRCFDCVDRRHRRLPVRAGRGGQSRDRGPRLPARRDRARARRRARGRPPRRPIHRRCARPTPREQGRSGRWLGSSDRPGDGADPGFRGADLTVVPKSSARSRVLGIVRPR